MIELGAKCAKYQETKMENAEILAADHSQVIPETQFTFKCHPLVYEMHLSNFLERERDIETFVHLFTFMLSIKTRKKERNE